MNRLGLVERVTTVGRACAQAHPGQEVRGEGMAVVVVGGAGGAMTC